MAPRILLTLDYNEDSGFLVKSEYAESLRRAGARVDTCFYDKDDFREKMKACDGILIPGGLKDIAPEKYGAKTVHPQTKLNPVRENFDFYIAEQILASNTPCLAVCWGFQVFNVVLGGSLYQHLPEDFPSDIDHEQKVPARIATHKVIFDESSESRKRFGLKEMMVNSTHHQGIKTLGKNLVCEARASDGLIEAFRHDQQKYLWGFEWHPERLAGDPFIADFVKNCSAS